MINRFIAITKQINFKGDASIRNFLNKICAQNKMDCQSIRLSAVIRESIVDGFGIRYVVFTQGCPHHCSGCHNPGTHDFGGGYNENILKIYNEIVLNPLLQGVTISGGEPFSQPNAVLCLIDMLKNSPLDITVFTGYTFEELLAMNNNVINEIISNTDLLIDGKFELGKRDLTMQFRGSANQRLLNGKKSMLDGKAVPYEIENY